MSIYAMSDLHGCKQEFDAMLGKIRFSEYDELYIVGDVVDRGREPAALMQEIMAHDNIHLICGNHDAWFAKYIPMLIEGKHSDSYLYYHRSNDLITWLHYNGGMITADQFMDLDYPACYDMERYMEDLPYYKELEILGKKFVLIHAGLGSCCRAGIKPSEVDRQELIWSHIGMDDNPWNDTTMIVGHTPTFLYGPEYEGKIAHGRNLLHIDCGCVFGRTLGCVRLDDMEEFYVPSTYLYLKVR